MYCQKCGASIQDNCYVCVKCGANTSGQVESKPKAALAKSLWGIIKDAVSPKQSRNVAPVRTVYYTLDGKCYHYSRSCLRTENVLSCPENLVFGLGMTKCKKCGK